MIHFLCRKLKEIIVSDKLFQIYHFYSTGTATKNKLDDDIPVAHF